MRLEDVYDRLDEQRRLARILMPRFLRLLQAWHELVASVFQLSPEEFRLDDPATRKQLAHAAERVVLIDQGTRAALREVLREGQQRGYSTHEIAHGVPADGYGGIDGLYLNTWKGRSELIAATEVAEAQVSASLSRYAATGMVTRVQLVESEDTDEPCASRNGQVVPIASKPGLLHPRCRLSMVPVVDEAGGVMPRFMIRLRPSDYEVLALMAGMERRRLDDQAATIIECVVRFLRERDPVFAAAWQAFQRGGQIPPPPAGYAALSQDTLEEVLREAREVIA